MSADKSPVFLLLETDPTVTTRTYTVYASDKFMVMGICSIFEEHLKPLVPVAKDISYISQLFDFLDNLAQLSCLVYDDEELDYKPCSRKWIKQTVFAFLRSKSSTVLPPSTQTTLDQPQPKPSA